MRWQETVDVDATPDRVWSMWMDVERWPEWTSTVTAVRRMSEPPLRVGSRVRLRQPRIGEMEWRVTELEPDHAFVWVADRPGVRTVAGHWVEPRAGGVTVRLAIEQTGPLAPLAGLLAGSLTRRYLHTEASGLKRRCEPSD